MNIDVNEDIYELLKDQQVTGEAGGGFVKIILNGDYSINKIEYENNDLIMKDASMFVDLIKYAHNDALKRMNELVLKLLKENVQY